MAKFLEDATISVRQGLDAAERSLKNLAGEIHYTRKHANHTPTIHCVGEGSCYLLASFLNASLQRFSYPSTLANPASSCSGRSNLSQAVLANARPGDYVIAFSIFKMQDSLLELSKAATNREAHMYYFSDHAHNPDDVSTGSITIDVFHATMVLLIQEFCSMITHD